VLDDDLRSRARRLKNGDFRIVDLDRIFLDLRERSHGYSAFREIGDFVAHRPFREKGPFTQVAKDVFTSVDVWSLRLRGIKVELSDIERAAFANLRLASDEQIRNGCGCQRGTAKKRMQGALEKIARRQTPSDLEYKALMYLGNSFIWKPAFTSSQLFDEFTEVLTLNSIVKKAEISDLKCAEAFVSLYALSIMHGSKIKLNEGANAKLYAGFSNRDRFLEVKIDIQFSELGKPLMVPVCLFLTNILPDEYCEQALGKATDTVLYDHWNFPIEIGINNRLCRVASC
jgi:hypothetical protein